MATETERDKGLETERGTRRLGGPGAQGSPHLSCRCLCRCLHGLPSSGRGDSLCGGRGGAREQEGGAPGEQGPWPVSITALQVT